MVIFESDMQILESEKVNSCPPPLLNPVDAPDSSTYMQWYNICKYCWSYNAMFSFAFLFEFMAINPPK